MKGRQWGRLIGKHWFIWNTVLEELSGYLGPPERVTSCTFRPFMAPPQFPAAVLLLHTSLGQASGRLPASGCLTVSVNDRDRGTSGDLQERRGARLQGYWISHGVSEKQIRGGKETCRSVAPTRPEPSIFTLSPSTEPAHQATQWNEWIPKQNGWDLKTKLRKKIKKHLSKYFYLILPQKKI